MYDHYPEPVRARYLPAVPGEGFELGKREPLASGLRRLSVDQCQVALDGLTDSSADVDAGIHEARKAMKRIRAILRLVRPQVGERIYHYENRTLRDAARLVAPARDAVVCVETLTSLQSRFEGVLDDDVFEDLAGALDQRAARIRREVVDGRGAVDSLVSTLQRTRVRFAAWPVDPDEAGAYGGGIPNRFGSVEGGLAATYRRGRKEMRRAYRSPTTSNFHEWRKRVKYLRHQMEVLEPLWPGVIAGTAGALDHLGDLLGDEHDLADLLGVLTIDPDLCPDPVERSLLAALAQHRRAELRAEARMVGTRVYAEKPGRFVDRIEAYWDAAWIPIDVGLDLEA